MRQLKTLISGMLLITVVSVFPAAAADVAKIGMFDFQRFLLNSEAGKVAKDRVNEQGRQMETELATKGKEIEDLKQQIEREAMVMSREMREEKEREIRIKINDFKTLQKRFMGEFKQMERKLISFIQEDVFSMVGDIGKKEGYLLIVEKKESGVVYSPGAIDITDRMIEQYNAKYEKNKAKFFEGVE